MKISGTTFKEGPELAESWLVRLQAQDCSPAERVAFEHWRGADPANARAFTQAQHIHQRAAELISDPLLQAAARAARRDTARGRER